MVSLVGRTALVTGSSRGIGLQIARRLAARGSNVVLLARNEDLLRQQLKELPITSDAQRHSKIVSDLSQLQTIEPALRDEPLLKQLSILVNSAGISQTSLLMKSSPQGIRQLITTNLTAPILLSKHLTRTLLRNSPSSIINISSLLATQPTRGSTVYTATKAGLIGFSQALSLELAGKVRVNTISPGLVRDTDMGREVTLEEVLQKSVKMDDVVNAVIRVLEDESVNGQNIEVGPLDQVSS